MGPVLEAIVLGIVQGLTEFLPVSSSGHLEIAKFLLGDAAVGNESLLMTVSLHFATALSTVFVFRKDILELFQNVFVKRGQEQRKYILLIVLSMIPAVLVGLLLESEIEALFVQNLLLVGLMLFVTGVLLFVADKKKETTRKHSVSSAIIVGLAQAIAILPGISRSGSTIATSVILGIDKEKAAKFSFLMVLPLIFGAMAKDLLEGDFSEGKVNYTALIAGFVTAFVVGILACRWMIKIVKNSKLKYFAYYCFLIAIIAIVYAVSVR